VGLTSPKEITWIFLSGTIVFALFAWTLLAFSRLCVVMCLGGGFTVFLTFLYYNFNDEDRMFNVALAIVVILTCLAAYFRAAKDRLVRPRTILLWFTP
jgi:ABC-type Fe3+ transport system permease subunit